jgi:hypothetical protein
MTKIASALIVSTLLLAACGQDQPPPARPAPAAQPAPAPVAAGPGMRTGVVTASSANLRAGPNNRARRIALLPRGTEVDIIEVAGAWAKVRAAGEEGYVFARSLRPQ